MLFRSGHTLNDVKQHHAFHPLRLYQSSTPVAFADLSLYIEKSDKNAPFFYMKAAVYEKGARKGLPINADCWYSAKQVRGGPYIAAWMIQLCRQAKIPLRRSHSG